MSFRKIKQNTKIWQLLVSVLVFAWFLFQYREMNRFYAVFLLFFFFIQFFSRKRYFMLLVVSVLSLVLFKTPVLDTLQALKDKSLSVIWNPGEPLVNMFTPNSGEDVLPAEVQDILFLLRKFEISSYALSAELQNDALIYQRTLEGVWPIQYDSASPYIFKFDRETKYDTPNCQLIERREEIDLVYCD